jgi:hypothetical protein
MRFLIDEKHQKYMTFENNFNSLTTVWRGCQFTLLLSFLLQFKSVTISLLSFCDSKHTGTELSHSKTDWTILI